MPNLIDSPHRTAAPPRLLAIEPLQVRGCAKVAVLAGASMRIGSAPDCDVVVSVASVADEHCIIDVEHGRTVVRPVDRRTWLDDIPVITASILAAGQRLAVGPAIFCVRAANPHKIESSRLDTLAPLIPAAQPPRKIAAPASPASPDVEDSSQALRRELEAQLECLREDIHRQQQ